MPTRVNLDSSDVTWAGRYPVSRDIDRMELSRSIHESDGEKSERLFNRLEQRIDRVSLNQ